MGWLLQKDKDVNHEWFKGNKGETVSSRLGRVIERDDCFVCTWSAKIFCRLGLAPLAWILGQGSHHCVKSIQPEFREK